VRPRSTSRVAGTAALDRTTPSRVADRSTRREQTSTDDLGRGTATVNTYHVKCCLLCGDPRIDATQDDRFVTTSCLACHAVLLIEFDPPGEPALRGRIERIDEATDGGVFESGPDTRTARRRDSQNSPTARSASRRRSPSVDRPAEKRSSDRRPAAQGSRALTSRARFVSSVSPAIHAASSSVPSADSRSSRSARSQSSSSVPGSPPRAS
jgi:hypothetical protein